MTNDYNASSTICAKIAELRRASGMTQDALAEKLGVTYQAVSKWENGISCPDITLIPAIADIFDVSIDALFGRTEEKETSSDTLPWENDNKLHAVLFRGTKILSKQEYKNEKMNITLDVNGSVKEIICSEFPVSCHNVEGNISAGAVTCDVVEGDVNAGSITCNTIEGDVNAGGITCDSIEGDIVMRGGGSIACNGEICGDILAEQCNISVNGDVSGDILMREKASELSIEGDVSGDIIISGANCTVTIEGDTDGDIDISGTNCTVTIEDDMDGGIDISGANCTVTIEGDMDGDIDVNAEGATLHIEGDIS